MAAVQRRPDLRANGVCAAAHPLGADARVRHQAGRSGSRGKQTGCTDLAQGRSQRRNSDLTRSQLDAPSCDGGASGCDPPKIRVRFVRILFHDFETRGTLDLKRVGVHRYSKHLTTDVWCCAFAVDDGPTKIWKPGDPVPSEFIEAATNP